MSGFGPWASDGRKGNLWEQHGAAKSRAQCSVLTLEAEEEALSREMSALQGEDHWGTLSWLEKQQFLHININNIEIYL